MSSCVHWFEESETKRLNKLARQSMAEANYLKAKAAKRALSRGMTGLSGSVKNVKKIRSKDVKSSFKRGKQRLDQSMKNLSDKFDLCRNASLGRGQGGLTSAQETNMQNPSFPARSVSAGSTQPIGGIVGMVEPSQPRTHTHLADRTSELHHRRPSEPTLDERRYTASARPSGELSPDKHVQIAVHQV
jgi:hypothetical protein